MKMHLLAHLLAASAGLSLILAQVIEPDADGYTYIGCYTDTGAARALTGANYQGNEDDDASECASFCGGTTYFGLEFSQYSPYFKPASIALIKTIE